MSIEVIACLILSFVAGLCFGVLCLCVTYNRRDDLEDDDLGYLDKIIFEEMSDSIEVRN